MNDSTQAKIVRDEVIRKLSQHQFDAGMLLLKENAATLPEHMRLECVATHHFYRKDFQAAIQVYEEAITLAPSYLIARYQYLVGVKNERQENLVEAFNRYQAAIGIEPTFVDAYVELGGLLMKVEDFEGAAQCYRDALKIDPLDIANLHNLKLALQRLVKIDTGRYQAELKEIEASYLRLSKVDAPSPSAAREW